MFWYQASFGPGVEIYFKNSSFKTLFKSGSSISMVLISEEPQIEKFNYFVKNQWRFLNVKLNQNWQFKKYCTEIILAVDFDSLSSECRQKDMD